MLLGSGPLAAQTDLNFSGYLEHQYSLDYQSGDWRHIDYDRLRLDLDAEAGKRTGASAGLVWQLYRGQTEVNLARSLPSDIAAEIGDIRYYLSNTQFLNHAYIGFRPGNLEIIVGKQYLTWGAAWVFNPTELFRPKNIFEPSYDREGVGALVVKIPIGTLSDVLVGLVPEGNLEMSGKIVRLRHPLGSIDFSALAAVLHERPSPIPGLPGIRAERRFTLGGDLSGEVGYFGWWFEGTWSDRAEERWVEATFGGNHSLSDGTLLLVELYLDSRGEWDAPYSTEAWLSRYTGERRTLGKLTAYAMASRPVGRLWNVAVSVISNPSDRSGVLVPSVSYDFAQDVEVTFIGLAFFGSDVSEYGRDQVGGFVRARVYF